MEARNSFHKLAPKTANARLASVARQNASAVRRLVKAELSFCRLDTAVSSTGEI